MSEALRLAEVLDSVVGGALCNRAAAELRRQHAECEALRADAEKAKFELVEQVRCFLEEAAGEQVVFDTIVAERDALRADAERYRWMKQEVKRIPPVWEMSGWDAAIDAARAALKEANHE